MHRVARLQAVSQLPPFYGVPVEQKVLRARLPAEVVVPLGQVLDGCVKVSDDGLVDGLLCVDDGSHVLRLAVNELRQRGLRERSVAESVRNQSCVQRGQHFPHALCCVVSGLRACIRAFVDNDAGVLQRRIGVHPGVVERGRSIYFRLAHLCVVKLVEYAHLVLHIRSEVVVEVVPYVVESRGGDGIRQDELRVYLVRIVDVLVDSVHFILGTGEQDSCSQGNGQASSYVICSFHVHVCLEFECESETVA